MNPRYARFYYTLLVLSMFSWGAAAGSIVTGSTIPWMYFSSIATVLTCAAAILLKGTQR